MGVPHDTTIVAIVRAEDPFLDEWVAYHRLLGTDQFILYDDDPRQNLAEIVAKHSAYVRVFRWSDNYHIGEGKNRQTKAYLHSLQFVRSRWVAFIDIDEFIVLRAHLTLSDFLCDYRDAQAVVLTWHLFGHNGFYDDPPGLVTELLTKRQAAPGNRGKSIVQCEYITSIPNAHACRVVDSAFVLDANHRRYHDEQYIDKTALAHINHYMCRSFTNWMARVTRGEVAYSLDSHPESAKWRYDHEACLKQFVAITRTFNELTDEYMLRYSQPIRQFLSRYNAPGAERQQQMPLLHS